MGNSLCCRRRRSRGDADLYTLLGVAPTASREEIDAAFTRLRQAHGSASGFAAKLLDEVKKAYEVLSDPRRRAQYDEALENERTGEFAPYIVFSPRQHPYPSGRQRARGGGRPPAHASGASAVKTEEEFDQDGGFQAKETSNGLWSEATLQKSRIPSNQLTVGKLLSEGAFGNVWLAQFVDLDVVVKQLKEEDQTQTNAVAFASEIVRMTQINHPKITRFIGVEWTKQVKTRAVVESLPLGDLRTLLSSSKAADLNWADFKCQVAMDIVDALAYVEATFRDVSFLSFWSRSVLLTDEEGHCKLSVFAAVRERWHLPTGISKAEYLNWLAPEIILGEDNTDPAKSAIYSLGVLLCELDTCKPPFYDALNPDGSPMSSAKIAQQVAFRKLRPSVSDECPEGIAALATECLAFDPQARPTATSVAYRLRDILKNEL